MPLPSKHFRVRLKQLSLLDPKLWPPQNCGPGHGQKEARERRTRFRDTTADSQEDVVFDAAAAQLIMDDLELEMEPIRYGLYRYAKHGFRPKSRGLGGSLLGDTGEVLTLVLRRRLNAVGATSKLIRVVGYVASSAGGPFPMPDFIITDPKIGNRALEVKSREAFDVLEIQNQKPNGRIGACDALKGAREEALHQLGFPPKLKSVKKKPGAPVKPFVPPTHPLKLMAPHSPVPFPLSGGVAVAVLVRDARIVGIKSAGVHHLVGKENCAKFSCSNCFEETGGSPIHATLVEMSNSPGVLAVLGSPDDSGAWYRTYERWRQALWSREPAAVAVATSVLETETRRWLEGVDADRRPVVTAFWGRYLRDAPSERGIVSHVPLDALPTSANGMPNWQPAVPREAVVRSVSPLNVLVRTTRLKIERLAYHDDQGRRSCCLDIGEEKIRLTVLTSRWWNGASIAAGGGAVAQEAMDMAAMFGLFTPGSSPQTRPAVVKVSGAEEVVGWHAAGVVDASLGWIEAPAVWRLSAFDDGRALIEVMPAGLSLALRS